MLFIGKPIGRSIMISNVIDLNASVESGAYVSRMSAAAHAGAASRDPVSESDSSSSLESSDSSSPASNARLTRSSSSSSSTSSSSTSSADTPSVATRPAVKKGGKKKMKISQKRSSSSASDLKSVVPSGKLTIVHRIDSKHSLRKALATAHERYGHVSPKKLVYFKKKGRVYSSTIPVRGALEFKVKDCPVCAVMKCNRPKKPAFLHFEEDKS